MVISQETFTLKETGIMKYNREYLEYLFNKKHESKGVMSHIGDDHYLLGPKVEQYQIINSPAKMPSNLSACIASAKKFCIECDNFKACPTVKDYLKAYSLANELSVE